MRGSRNEIRALEDKAAVATKPPNELLALILLASPGRNYELFLENFNFARPVVISADDLEVIGRTEAGNPLMLWQYAKASDRIRDYAKLFSFDPLDEFAFWRSNNFSYYMSDDEKPTGVLIASGTALDLRVEARDVLDIHALPHPRSVGYVEVMRFQTPDVPIYMARPGALTTFSLAVDGMPLTLWVQAVRSPDETRFDSLMRGLADFIAYWIWQFQSHLTKTLERLAEHFDCLVIQVDVVESENWFDQEAAFSDPLQIIRTARGLRLTFQEGAAAFFAGSDNAGEREIVRLILEALHDFGRDFAAADRPSEQAISRALEEIAPLGQKKKIVILGGDAGTYLDESELPPYRPIQPAATEEWRDRERELLDQINLPLGPIATGRRVPTLNKMVEQAFAVFEQLVAALDPAGLLETLVALGERLIWIEEHRRRLTPTRLACYSTIPKMVEELKRDGSTLAATAISHRFITEYVVAQPPRGFRPFSLEAYDELNALAALIVEWGRQSDTLHYGLADTELSVLNSGRLSWHDPSFTEAVEDYGERIYTEQVQRSSLAFSSMFQDPAGSAAGPLISSEEVDRATEAEFGVSITQIAEYVRALIEIGMEQQGPTKSLPEIELRDRLSSELGWENEELDSAFRLLSLGPRAGFLEPPPGFDRRDVYPWVFNRRMSYLSRPLLLREGESGARELVWGVKALTRTNEYLFRQVVEGRLRAESGELRSLQGRVANLLGEAFNDRVADVYEAPQGLMVRRRVKRIAGRLIERGPGQPLGDIDVLVANESARHLLLVETKDFSIARTPAEFTSEERKLHEALKNHNERSSWINANLGDTLQWLGISDPDPSAWRVSELVVVSGEAFTPGLRKLAIPVRSFSALREGIAAEGSDAHM